MLLFATGAAMALSLDMLLDGTPNRPGPRGCPGVLSSLPRLSVLHGGFPEATMNAGEGERQVPRLKLRFQVLVAAERSRRAEARSAVILLIGCH